VDFDFTSEQYALRDAARELFEKASPPSRLREIWAADGERDDRAWTSMAEMGLLGLLIPASHGGAGGDETDVALVLEEAGRAALPEPYVETVVAGFLLAKAGTDAQKDQWLPKIASGEALVTVAFGSPYVVDADRADLVLADIRGVPHALPKRSFRAKRVVSSDRSRRLFEIEPDASKQTRMAAQGEPIVDAMERGVFATASVLNGVSMRLMEMTVDYVGGREQFGKPVGSFQAVKHKLASAHVELTAARAAAWYAAYALAQGFDDATVAAAVAKVSSVRAGALVNAEALQCHAGIGFTWEHDLHLWLKRGNALEAAFGPAGQHRRDLRVALFGGTDA
jgi:alkylation response protein AidB-like acyl-CoA dehydrogenase